MASPTTQQVPSTVSVISEESHVEKRGKEPTVSIVQDDDPEVVWVDFDRLDDPENPMAWSPLRKWLILFSVSCMGFVSVFGTTTIAPAAPQIIQQFHSHNALDRTLLLEIWELGEGIGPFFIAPLSERFGRLLVFHIGNLLALCFLVSSALSVNIPMLIILRFLTGCCLPALALGPAIVGDMFPPSQLGLAISLCTGCQVLGSFISPVIGAYIAQTFGWRWAIWLSAIILGTFSLFLMCSLRETYAVVILGRRAQRLQKQDSTKIFRTQCQTRIDASTILSRVLKPTQILIQSPVILLATSYSALSWALYCLVNATLTETMEATYPSTFSRGSVGLTFLSDAIGSLIAMLLYGLTSDRYVAHRLKTKGDAFKPESRLVHLLFAAVLLPSGFLLYGWTLDSRVQYIVPLIGTCAIGFSSAMATLPLETYLVEVYKIHSASAVAAGVIARAVSAATLTLSGPALYEKIGLGWGNSVLALMAAVFIPPLGLLIRYGDWFRSKDRFGAHEP